ncbi:type VI secretion system baseplate subunit TssG [uncultured Shewanella sp.]|uniref:type VI secretion system baseplate subunit TssG n=1 Tax=uncultured Shewanella sp. TaxID=173975 RepID=UPI00260AD2FC|nr:type VI secretion system baseplate subunit TssG [uncultured Shewanella sp.]
MMVNKQSKSKSGQFDLIQDLMQYPEQYNFVQAIRLLRSQSQSDVKNYCRKRVRIRPNLSLGFSATEIIQLEQQGDYCQLTTNLFGLYGAGSPIPTFYTEELFEEQSKDRSVGRDFLDIFNQMFFEQYFQASSKYRFLPKLLEEQDVETLDRLFSFVGLGSQAMRDNTEDAGLLLRYSGLLTQLPRSSEGLQAIIDDIVSEHSHEPIGYKSSNKVWVKEFVETWVDIPNDQQSVLGGGELYLGQDTYLGTQCKDMSQACHIVIQVDDAKKFKALQPNGKLFKRISVILRHYIDDLIDVSVCLSPTKNAIEPPKLNNERSALLGMNTWLGGVPDTVTFPLQY